MIWFLIIAGTLILGAFIFLGVSLVQAHTPSAAERRLDERRRERERRQRRPPWCVLIHDGDKEPTVARFPTESAADRLCSVVNGYLGTETLAYYLDTRTLAAK